MNKVLIYPAFMALMGFLLCSCVAVDVLTMDTAEIKPVKRPTFSTYTTMGVNASFLALRPFEEAQNINIANQEALMQVISIASPVSDNSEMGFRFWTSGNSAGSKLYGKFPLQRTDTNAIAIIPAAIFLVSGRSSYEGHYEEIRAYNSAGLELQ
ncbi:MAG: hypothetical protein U1B83_03400, partial [Candidatus Cloacimonadaceae bacterium]|nr:hypothetical protein [Candidatus Cloacimonadaceae bacterium]